MPNQNGKVYGLTILSPIIDDEEATPSHDLQIRNYLAKLPTDERSPFALAPATHLARLVVMDDVIYVGMPACEEHLKSKYLILESNCDGDLTSYLTGLATAIPEHLDAIWSHCIGYPGAANLQAFLDYMKSCQIETTFSSPQSTTNQFPKPSGPCKPNTPPQTSSRTIRAPTPHSSNRTSINS
ncbi:hypothetical protein [Tunturiibacter gelidiferens]|uniref:hypothetical protein n=1 Tax=Tunturiibacter gelidiferens TaxID=3069689 RepID=UPI003D9ABC82